MYLKLDAIKKHLNINDDFTADDVYLVGLAEAVETIVERHIDNKLDMLASKSGGGIPKPLLQAMLLLLGHFYESREAVSYVTASEVPLSYDYILSLYKNYGKKYNV